MGNDVFAEYQALNKQLGSLSQITNADSLFELAKIHCRLRCLEHEAELHNVSLLEALVWIGRSDDALDYVQIHDSSARKFFTVYQACKERGESIERLLDLWQESAQFNIGKHSRLISTLCIEGHVDIAVKMLQDHSKTRMLYLVLEQLVKHDYASLAYELYQSVDLISVQFLSVSSVAWLDFPKYRLPQILPAGEMPPLLLAQIASRVPEASHLRDKVIAAFHDTHYELTVAEKVQILAELGESQTAIELTDDITNEAFKAHVLADIAIVLSEKYSISTDGIWSNVMMIYSRLEAESKLSYSTQKGILSALAKTPYFRQYFSQIYEVRTYMGIKSFGRLQIALANKDFEEAEWLASLHPASSAYEIACAYIRHHNMERARYWIDVLRDLNGVGINESKCFSKLSIAYAEIGDLENANRMLDEALESQITFKDRAYAYSGFRFPIVYRAAYDSSEPSLSPIILLYDPYCEPDDIDDPTYSVEKRIETFLNNGLASLELPEQEQEALQLFEEALDIAKSYEDDDLSFVIGQIVDMMTEAGLHARALEILKNDIHSERYHFDRNMIDYFIHRRDYNEVRRLLEVEGLSYYGDSVEDILLIVVRHDGVEKALELRELFGWDNTIGNRYLGIGYCNMGQYAKGFELAKESYGLSSWIETIIFMLPAFAKYQEGLDHRILLEVMEQTEPLMPKVGELRQFL